MNQVLIIEAQIKQYRLPFYELLVERLRGESIELQVGYSDPPPVEASKKDNCDLPAWYGKKVEGYWLLREKLLFQPLLPAALRAELVIVDQGNRFLLNHILLPFSRAGIKRVAFWGLGENRQDGRWPLSEWYRRKTLNWVSWWFAYTKGTARYLTDNGVPGSKITAVDNAVDTTQLRKQVGSISPEQRFALREALGISSAASVGIFCGMLDKVKGLPFLLEAAKQIHLRVPEFHLIVVGGGPEEHYIQTSVQGVPWVHFMGPRFAEEKSKLIAISDVFLMPGRVGLVILDAFAAGLPLLSTRLKIHGPEIEYLEEGTNGLLSEPEVSAFADMVSSLLSNRETLARLRCGALESGAKYTIDNMVANFELGIRQCLGTAVRSAAMSDVKNCELVD
jgi:L-malate glycosyltransferase